MLADAAHEGVQQDDRTVVPVAVHVRGGPAVAHRCRAGSRRRELAGDPLDVLGGNGRDLLGPLGRVLLELALKVVDRDVRPFVHERLVVQVLEQDRVRHGEGDGAVRTRRRHKELVRVTGRVRHPHVEGNELGTVLEATTLEALGARNVTLVGFEHVRAEVQDVLRVLVVAEVPVGLEEVRQVGRTTRRRAKPAVIQGRVRAERTQEVRDGVLRTAAALVERELFELAALLDLNEALSHFVVGLIPADTLPLTFAAFADALQRVEQTLGVVLVVQRRLTTGAQLAARVRVVRVAFDLDDPAVLDDARDAAHRRAELAHAVHALDVLVLVRVRELRLSVRTRQRADAGGFDRVRLAFALLPNGEALGFGRGAVFPTILCRSAAARLRRRLATGKAGREECAEFQESTPARCRCCVACGCLVR